MTRSISLAYLTTAPMGPVEAITLAAELGYDGVGLRALPAAPGEEVAPLLTDVALRRAVQARCAETGIRIADIEIVRIGAEFSTAAFVPFLELCGELGAGNILVAGDDADEGRLIASFAALCEAAAPFGVTAALEFMPWTAVPNATAALRVIKAAGPANGRVLVDTLHAARSDTSLADLASLGAEHLAYVQVCDAPAEVPTTVEGLIYTARRARLLPGAGGIDLGAMLDQLPANLPVSVEIPNDEGIAELGPREWARAALVATRALLASREVRQTG